MKRRIIHLRDDERGMTLVYVGLGFMAFMAATTLAIDVGMFMTARSQAQNSADAGALAGAVALAYNDYDNRTATGPAVQSAVNAAAANEVMHQTVSATPSDVTFPLGPTGLNNRVHVEVYRTDARSNPVSTLIGAVFGLAHVDIHARATAEASAANAVDCVRPFMIPDKWTEKQTGPWDPDDNFDMYDNKGNLLSNPDKYVGDLDSPDYTGYNPQRDKGTLLMLRAGTGNNISPSMYFSWQMPGGSGADFYKTNISGCNHSRVSPGDLTTQEPGNMVGPTNSGVDALMAQDPDAHWDTDCLCVMGSAFGTSPRVFPIPLYDPVYYATGKANGRTADFKVANWLGIFIDHRAGNNVFGYVTPIAGTVDSTKPIPKGAFAKSIRLVE